MRGRARRRRPRGFGEIVFCSVPYGAWPTLGPALQPLISGKVVLNSANPYPRRDGDFAQAAIAAGEGAGVAVARLLPGARLVRAFNTVYFKTLQTEAHRAGDRVGIPLASNDGGALDVAARLVRDAGFEPVVVGPLARARSFRSGDAGLQHRHERRGTGPGARRRPVAVMV